MSELSAEELAKLTLKLLDENKIDFTVQLIGENTSKSSTKVYSLVAGDARGIMDALGDSLCRVGEDCPELLMKEMLKILAFAKSRNHVPEQKVSPFNLIGQLRKLVK